MIHFPEIKAATARGKDPASAWSALPMEGPFLLWAALAQPYAIFAAAVVRGSLSLWRL